MKLQLRYTNGTRFSKSLKDLAAGLSTKLGYRVLRTGKVNTKRRQFMYGGGVDKISQYKYFTQNEIPCLEWTVNSDQADAWLAHGHTVFGRSLLKSSCGKGIVVIEPGQPIPEVPVYAKYAKKKREFRVHVFKGQVVAVVEKKRKAGWEGQRDTKIRNLANGYVFVQNVQNEPEGVRELAIRASKVSNSDFAGVDIGYNEQKDQLFVIEVNSAPGITGSNIGAYVETIYAQV